MKRSISPLRYPGGKIKIYDQIESIIKENCEENPVYVEGFAGGAGLALQLLKNNVVKSLILNDYDYAIYSFWKSILDYNKEFVRKVKEVDISLDEWKHQKYIYNNINSFSMFEIGFATFYLNRTNRSGIIKGGPIGGKKQNGNYKIDSRFNKNKLIEEIKEIGKYKNKIKLYNMDALYFIDIISKSRKDLFIYFDPPYVNKGKQLYKNFYNELDHIRLGEKIKNKLNNKKFIITYDDNIIIRKLYSNYLLKEFNLSYSAGKNKSGKEIIIFSPKVNNLEKVM